MYIYKHLCCCHSCSTVTNDEHCVGFMVEVTIVTVYVCTLSRPYSEVTVEKLL